jgi:hypothetical protein
MARRRQAMCEASIETLSVIVQPVPPAATVVSLARPEQTSGATMLEGDATELAKQIAALLREQGALVS